MAKNSKSKKAKAESPNVFGAKNDVRVAAVLGKTHAARCFHPEDIARDAIQLERHIKRARDATTVGKPVEKAILKIREIAERYDAELVRESAPEGLAFGLRFLDGSSAGMSRGIFRVC